MEAAILLASSDECQSAPGLIMVLDRCITRGAVISAFESLLAVHPKLRCGLGRRESTFVWQPLPLVDLDSVIVEGASSLVSWSDVERWVGARLSERIPESESQVLWRLRLLRYHGNSALFFQWHHILADGAAMGQLWASLSSLSQGVDTAAHRLISHWALARLALWVVCGAWLVALRWLWLLVVTGFPRQPQRYRGPALDGTRTVACSLAPVVSLQQLKVLHSIGTVNDLVLAAVVRAVAHCTRDYAAQLAIVMPVNIRLGIDDPPVLRNAVGSMTLLAPAVRPAGEHSRATARKIASRMALIKVRRGQRERVFSLRAPSLTA